MTQTEDHQQRYIGTAALAQRYGRASRTMMRWAKEPPPGFPRPTKIHGRNMWRMDEVEAYELKTSSPAEAA